MISKFIITCFLCFCTSCTKIDTIELPNLDAKSFSSEQILDKKKSLEEKKKYVRRINSMEESNESR